MDKFNLEYQYKLYLKRVALNESTMHPQQKIQVKDAFYGGIGQFLMLTQNDLVQLEEDKACEMLDSIESQVSQYFLSRTINHN